MRGRREHQRPRPEHFRQRARVVLRVGRDLGVGDVARGGHELAEVTVGDWRRVNPEPAHGHAMNRRLLRVMTVRAHAERAAGYPDHAGPGRLDLGGASWPSPDDGALNTGRAATSLICHTSFIAGVRRQNTTSAPGFEGRKAISQRELEQGNGFTTYTTSRQRASTVPYLKGVLPKSTRSAALGEDPSFSVVGSVRSQMFVGSTGC